MKNHSLVSKRHYSTDYETWTTLNSTTKANTPTELTPPYRQRQRQEAFLRPMAQKRLKWAKAMCLHTDDEVWNKVHSQNPDILQHINTLYTFIMHDNASDNTEVNIRKRTALRVSHATHKYKQGCTVKISSWRSKGIEKCLPRENYPH